MTPARSLILSILFTRRAVLSVAELTRAVRECDATVDGATVYRGLGVLADLGVVERDVTRHGPVRYRIAGPTLSSVLVASVRCSRCGAVQHLSAGTLSAIATSLSEQTAFTLAPGSLELRGLCPGCSAL